MSAFQVPAASTAPTTFTFDVPRAPVLGVQRSPRRFEIPLAQYIDSELRQVLAIAVDGVTQKNLDEERAQVIWEAQLGILRRYSPEVISSTTDEQKVAIFRAWYEASNVSMGESSASSSS